MEKISKRFVTSSMALLIGCFVLVQAVDAATIAKRTVDSPYFKAGSKIQGIKVEVTPSTGAASNAVVTESTMPEGFAVSNIKTTNGSAVQSGNTIVWTLSGATAKVEMTYDLTAPASNEPLYAVLGGVAVEGSTKIVMETVLRHEPGLGPKWVIGAEDGIWAIQNGVLRAYAYGGTDPKHAWVNLDLANGDYTVTCDCRMVNWVDGDLPRAGISTRINPDNNGANIGSDRGINLLFHNDQNSVDMLNDLTAWGTLTDIAWETGKWYTMALVGAGSYVEAFFIEKGAGEATSDAAYLNSWDDAALDTRSPGFPGLAASSQAGLEVQFDNFKVLDSSGKVVFQDDFETVETTPLTATRTVPETSYKAGETLTGITVSVTPASGRTSNAKVTETIPTGFTATNIQTTNGSASVTGNTLVWTLSGATSKVTMTYDLAIPATEAPLYGELTGVVQDGSWQISLGSVNLSLQSGLRSEWVIGSGGGAWAVSDGVLRAYANNATDPKHAWVNLTMADGDYTVICDCCMVNWNDADLSRAGIATRINPDNNGANVGSDRGICLLFHNDKNSVDMLNDLTAWGTLTDIAWETGKWYTFALVGNGTTVDAYFIEKGVAEPLSDAAYLATWDDAALDARSPGFPGLTASTAAGLEARFDNFKVIDSSGKTVFEDTFDQPVSVSEWAIY